MPSPELDKMAAASSKVRGDDDAIYNILDKTLSAIKVSIAGGNVTINASDIQIGAVEIKNATDDTRATVGANGLHVDVRASALPTGAATEATLGLVKAKTDNLDVLLSTRATEATLAAVSGKLPATLGQKAMAASLAVAIASDQSGVPVTDNGGSLTVDSAQLPAALTAGGNLKTALLEAIPAGANRIGKVTIRNAADTADIDPPSSSQLPAALTGSGNLKAAILEALPAGANTIGGVNIASALPAGANNIGDVDVLTLPALPAGANRIGKVTIRNAADTADIDPPSSGQLPAALTGSGNLKVAVLEALPAGTARIGGAYHVSGQIIDENGVALTVKRAIANIAASTTDGSVIAAVTGKKLRILAAYAQCGATATNITFNTKPAGAGTAISPTMQNGANGGEVLPFSPFGWFETNASEGLSATTGAGSQTGVLVLYVEV